MSEVIGQADTVKDLIEILQRLDQDSKVRARSLSHDWPVVVEQHQLCVTVDMGS